MDTGKQDTKYARTSRQERVENSNPELRAETAKIIGVSGKPNCTEITARFTRTFWNTLQKRRRHLTIKRILKSGSLEML